MVSPEPVYHSSWRGTPWQLVVWGLRQLGLSGGAAGEDRLAVGQFIILTNIQDFARKITLAASTFDRIERIFSKESFKKYIQKMLGDSVPPSDLDVEVLLIYLTRDAKAIAYDGKTIRFRSSDQASATITNQDESIASLKTVIADHEAQLATLTERIEQLNMSARESLARKNRISATAAIRSRKVAEKALSERSLALSQLEEVFNNVLRASNQVEVMRVMESSTDVLKSLHKEVGGAERVKDVVDQLQEEMSKVSEVEDLIGNVGDANMTIDQADVDEELEAIAQEQKKSSERLRDADVAERLSRIDDDPGRRRIQNEGDANLDDVEKEILARSAELGRISLDESSRPIPERHKSRDTVHAIPAS
ncbi:MAG: hypothetical protein M1825_005720 [Sarcosagium campestre]|nr:MAG: hypothetical protein M1825_005720 [Sarcosagium campestre]